MQPLNEPQTKKKVVPEAIDMEAAQAQVFRLLDSLKTRLIERCGDNFVSFVLFGSWARGDVEPHSDVDMLLVFQHLPTSHSARRQWFREIEEDIEPEKMEVFQSTGYYPHFSIILRTMKEARRFSRLYLDMTEHAIILHDREAFFARTLEDFKKFLGRINAQKKWIGKKWYWVFSPDVEIGEVLPNGEDDGNWPSAPS